MINLDIKDEVMKEDKGIIIDLIRAAHSSSNNQLKTNHPQLNINLIKMVYSICQGNLLIKRQRFSL